MNKPGFNIFSLKTDEASEVGGVWHDYLGGSRVLVARDNNIEYATMMMKLREERRVELDKGGDLADKISREIYLKCKATCILKGWEGFVDPEGDELVYSVDNSMKVLEMTDVFFDISVLSNEGEHYRESKILKAKANIKKP